MSLPVLYSFRRCPYAMRARLALIANGLSVELREVALRAKPAAMVAASPKATVPVLILPDGRVIDESLEVMRWAYRERGVSGWLDAQAATLVDTNDGMFKYHLDRYKYCDRYPMDAVDHRAAGTTTLCRLDAWIARRALGEADALSIADFAILPFVRQFAETDRCYFDGLPLHHLQRRLGMFLKSEIFAGAMLRWPPWHAGDPPTVFPAASAIGP